jgi:TPR repeat protein
LAETTARAAGFRKDYEVCRSSASEEAVASFCTGGGYLLGQNLATGEPLHKDPALAFKNTLQAAEKGYVPAENAVALMYANGKGVEQNYAEAAKWWTKAAEAGHLQAASHVSMVYRGSPGVRSDAALSAKWAKFVEEHAPKANE